MILDALNAWIATADPGAIRGALEAALAEAETLGRADLSDALRRLAVLTEVEECLALESPEEARAVAEFLAQAVGRLESEPSWVLQESARRWGDYLQLLDPTPLAPSPAALVDDEPIADETPAIDSAALLKLLGGEVQERESDSAVSCSGSVGIRKGEAPAEPNHPSRIINSSAGASPSQGQGNGPGESGTATVHRHQAQEARRPHLPPRDKVAAPARVSPGVLLGSAEQRRTPAPAAPPELDPEFRDAFLAEADDLFERVEGLVMNLHRAPDSAEVLHELGRCFHTLKGAAGSVGLVEFAGRVHALEDEIEGATRPIAPELLDLLDVAVTDFEDTLHALRKKTKRKSRKPAPSSRFAADEPQADEAVVGPGAADAPLRVPGARIDELMDLVSELIARRGVWTAQAETMHSLVATAQTCRNRLTVSLERLRDLGPGPQGELARLTRGLAEQAEDLSVLIQSAQAAIDPVTDEGDTFSRLSLQLWESLQSLQIVPVRGLFHRLERVARDAAKVEGRQVEVVMLGEETGLDRAVQDKAFEPLLHVVRNAVGHGIEPAHDRTRGGKSPVGRIVLEARREGNTLVLSVQDDGRGLDYAAIESKGRRLGLIGPEDTPDVARLNSLIFHSGFSTRPEANAISGRGVGMDVVAQEVARLRGIIDLDSRPGQGTRLTVRLPTRLALERGMVVRVDGQAFALPVESIEHAQPFDPHDQVGTSPAALIRVRDKEVPLVEARRALGISATPPASCPKLLLVRADGVSLAVLVDAIDGPRELVVKPLGPLLAGHPALAGTSVSVTGEVVLALNPSCLARRPRDWVSPAATVAHRPAPDRDNVVLVVDDSISVRRVAARHLHALGFEVDEVSDGLEALRKLRTRKYRLVLTDLEMPRMDGFELLAELGRQGILATTPVVVASTRFEPDTQRRARDLGAGAFLVKPIEPNELARTVEALGATR